MGHHTSDTYSTNEPLYLVVGMHQTASPNLQIANEEWEDLCRECGTWEWIDGELGGEEKVGKQRNEERNEFGGETPLWKMCSK